MLKQLSREGQWPRLHATTLLFLAGIALFAAFSLAWLLGQPAIERWMSAWQQMQATPPWFVRLPESNAGRRELLGILGAILLGTFVLVRSIPKPTRWAKAIAIGVVIAFSLRYALWRIFATLDLSTARNGILALALLILEIPFVLADIPKLFWASGPSDRRREADRSEALIRSGDYVPQVDIFLPTVNEPERILRRSIIGCQAIDYARKTIYVLDDGARPEIAALARELGCEYIARRDRDHAKAGNLNHALQYSSGELIAVLDADFVPTRNFLHRTAGFFQRPDVGLVQSHQNYYNPDPIVRNLGLAGQLTAQREEFSRYVQTAIDSVGATVCDGSGFVIRRSAVVAAGGFVTESLCEDYFTGLMLDSRHQRVLYLDENLCAGLAAENLSAYISQYQRWLNGSLQAFFIRANPLIIPNLSLRQRCAHLAHLAYWLASFARLLSLLIPVLWLVADIAPVSITPDESFYFLFLPFFLLLLARNWISDRSSSVILSEVYSVIHAIPFSLTAIQTLLMPFQRAFRVTPKGLQFDRVEFNLWLTVPLGGLWAVNALTMLGFFWQRGQQAGSLSQLLANLNTSGEWVWVFWWVYNLAILGWALNACIDATAAEAFEWFAWSRPVTLQAGDRVLAGVSCLVSEAGLRARVASDIAGAVAPGTVLKVSIDPGEWPGPLTLEARIVAVRPAQPDGEVEIDVTFANVTDRQYRHLVELLFCRPGQWLRRQHPDDFQTFFALLRRVLRPRFTLKHDVSTDAIPIR